MRGSRSAGEGAVDETLDAERVGVAEGWWEECVRHVLPADGADPAEDGGGADGRAAAVAGGWVGAAVDDALADLDAGGEAIADETAGAAFSGGEERGGGGEVGVGAVDGGGELAFEGVGDLEHFVGAGAGDEERGRAEDLFGEGRVGEELSGGGLEESWGSAGAGGSGGGGERSDGRVVGEGGGAGLVGFADASGEHGACGGGGEEL